ncbi:hypothetical protein Y032_0002g647 [Ancylostoma ceylanicum]|nr:hypothetical protein Y032_0002g647 [Ancylostoma ceylanicum]
MVYFLTLVFGSIILLNCTHGRSSIPHLLLFQPITSFSTEINYSSYLMLPDTYHFREVEDCPRQGIEDAYDAEAWNP